MRMGLIVLASLFAMQPILAAQGPGPDRQSHFGVITTVTFPSDARDDFKFYFDAQSIDLRSQDFEIGFIPRGRELGGDWGLSYVQKTYRDGSILSDTGNSCIQAGCFDFGRRDITQSVRLRGVFIHKFAPFVTIKGRAQIGLNFGGGIAKADGYVERHELTAFSDEGPPTETIAQVDATEVFLSREVTIKPLWKVEVMAAAIVAPGLKVRVGGGLNLANYPTLSLSASYLFGAR